MISELIILPQAVSSSRPARRLLFRRSCLDHLSRATDLDQIRDGLAESSAATRRRNICSPRVTVGPEPAFWFPARAMTASATRAIMLAERPANRRARERHVPAFGGPETRLELPHTPVRVRRL